MSRITLSASALSNEMFGVLGGVGGKRFPFLSPLYIPSRVRSFPLRTWQSGRRRRRREDEGGEKGLLLHHHRVRPTKGEKMARTTFGKRGGKITNSRLNYRFSHF